MHHPSGPSGAVRHRLWRIPTNRSAHPQGWHGATGPRRVGFRRCGECRGETPGRGSPNKTPLFAAVPVALRMRVFEGFRKTAPAALATTSVHPDSGVELPERTRVNAVLGNVKTAMTGTYHKAGPRNLPRYLAEFCYRFNRRFAPAAMLPRLGIAVVCTPPMPYRLLTLAEAHWSSGNDLHAVMTRRPTTRYWRVACRSWIQSRRLLHEHDGEMP
jgi:hypothetical protein